MWPLRSYSSIQQGDEGREYYYEITSCSQCQAQVFLQVRILPPTYRVSFLGIDGGGSRGVVSLGFMEELRQALGMHYAVQENFDYSIGTSSGKRRFQYLVPALT